MGAYFKNQIKIKMETLQQSNGAAVKEEKREVPEFNYIRDGHGVEHRIANLDHDMWAPRTGIVEVQALKRNKRHTKRISIKSLNDTATGAIFGVLLGVNPRDKWFNFETIMLGETEFFDLSKRKERHRYIVVSRHYTVEGSPNLNGAPEYKVVDKEQKANTYLIERSERKRSMEIVDNLDYQQLIDLAPAFGIDPKANSQAMLTEQICRIADTDHKKFLGVWDNPDRAGMTIFKRALKNGLINFDAINGYTYSGHALGFTEPVAFKYLTQNIQLMTTLSTLCDDKEKYSTYRVAPVAPKMEDPITAMEKEMARMKEENERLKALVATTPDYMSQLKAEAKELGIKGYQLMSEDKLKLEIEKAKTK